MSEHDANILIWFRENLISARASNLPACVRTKVRRMGVSLVGSVCVY